MKSIYLDAKVESDLDWRNQIRQAEEENSILWNLDLGFFNQLKKTLDDEGQYRSLRLALDHFVQKIWTPFSSKTKGVVIYQGAINSNLPIEYLLELVELLPDDIPLVADVTTKQVPSLSEKAHLLSSNRFGRIKVKHDASFNAESTKGVLLPSEMMDLPELERFLEDNPAVRLLSEAYLTLEWDGLDELYVFHTLDSMISRKIQGFEAAGGVCFGYNY